MADNNVFKSYAITLWLKLFLFVGSIFVGLMLFLDENEFWVDLLLMIFLLIFIFALVFSFVDGLVIKENVILITKNGIQTSIARGDIIQVTWAKGCPTTIVYNNDKKLGILDIGVHPLPFRNEILKWNKK